MKTCPTPCDDDCESPCHESHNVWWKKDHPDDWCLLNSVERRVVIDLCRLLVERK